MYVMQLKRIVERTPNGLLPTLPKKIIDKSAIKKNAKDRKFQ